MILLRTDLYLKITLTSSTSSTLAVPTYPSMYEAGTSPPAHDFILNIIVQIKAINPPMHIIIQKYPNVNSCGVIGL